MIHLNTASNLTTSGYLHVRGNRRKYSRTLIFEMYSVTWHTCTIVEMTTLYTLLFCFLYFALKIYTQKTSSSSTPLYGLKHSMLNPEDEKSQSLMQRILFWRNDKQSKYRIIMLCLSCSLVGKKIIIWITKKKKELYAWDWSTESGLDHVSSCQ